MKYISMLNPYSFKYLWLNTEGQKYIENIINDMLGIKESYKLLDFFNKTFNTVRSYVILESNDNVVLIDFNLDGRNIDDDLSIISFLEVSTTKKIYLIMFNNFKGKDCFNNNIYNKFIDDSFIYASTYEKQINVNEELTKYLYTMDSDNLNLYLHENELMKIDK